MEEIGVVGSEKETSVSGADIEKRKKDIVNLFKKSGNWIYYAILAVIVFVSVYIRTRNIPKLKDITTGTWTLGPDLDPFLFLRWAQYIAEHGKLYVLDAMRYVPLASICSGVACGPVDTYGDARFLSYMIAYLYKFLSFLNNQITVNYAAVIFPVIMAALTGIAFFLFARKIFYKEDKKIANIIALIATAIFVLVPSLLPRTIAGIPEKESAAFFFLFIAFYFFLEAYTSEKIKRGVIYGVLAGISTAILGLISGEVTFVFLGIAGGVLLAFLLGKIDGKKILFYSLWIFTSVFFVMPFSTRFDLSSLAGSTSTGLDFMLFFVLIMDFLIFKKKIFNLDDKLKKIKLPKPVISLLIGFIILAILASITFGISFIPDTIKDIISHTVQPFSQDRFSITVAENAQPYFLNDWIDSFGPIVLGIPLYFWLFFIGSVFLFNYMIKPLFKKEKIILTSSFLIFLFCLIFSKYSSTSILNGQSNLSLLVYFGGALTFLIAFGYIYFKRQKEGKFSVFEEFDFSYVFYFFILLMMIVASRGAVRLIMNLGAVSPVVIAFLAVKTSQKYLHTKEESNKIFIGIIVLLILLASVVMVWYNYQGDKSMAENFAPGVYQFQWQKAMAWVRDNTPVTAVFAHWWDYGYWVQTIGERATVLDGGNAIGVWDHYMGRNVLTSPNEQDALDFLYAHNTTNLLIDSTDIGKYGAFSSIGSDANYDRYSWIPNILRDDTQTQETNNGTSYIYPVGTLLDEDVLLNVNGVNVLLPRKNAAVAAVQVNEETNGEILQPTIYYVYNQQQYKMPLRYIYINGKLHDFGSGINAGIFTFPRIDVNANGQASVVPDGAAFYLSNRTIDSELVRLYLFDEDSSYFKLVHTEDNLFITDLKSQGIDSGEFVYYQGFQGPIKIWSVSYPSNIKLNATYLNTTYPPELQNVISGEY